MNLEDLVRAIAEGDARVVRAVVNPCPPCLRRGDVVALVSHPIPSWMNRWVCPSCRRAYSR